MLLERLKMMRCYKPANFGSITYCSLHHLLEASQDGYGQVLFLRPVDENGTIHCSLVMAKLKVPLTKVTSMPRLELTVAALSVKVSMMLRRELTMYHLLKE